MPRCVFERTNRLAQEYALAHGLAGTAGSDGHIAWEIGGAFLNVPVFNSADELRQVIASGQPAGRRVPLAVHAYASLVSLPKRISYGK